MPKMPKIIEEKVQEETPYHKNRKEEGVIQNNRSFFVLSGFRAFVTGFENVFLQRATCDEQHARGFI